MSTGQNTNEWSITVSTKTKKAAKRAAKQKIEDEKNAEIALAEKAKKDDNERKMNEKAVVILSPEAIARVDRQLDVNSQPFGENISSKRDLSIDLINAVKKITSSTKWVRLLHKNMIHNGFRYQEGENKDILPFDTTHECGPGGLYFCEEQYLSNWVQSGHELVADVDIPDDAQVAHMTTKSKADKIILRNIRPMIELKAFNDVKKCLEIIRMAGYTGVPVSIMNTDAMKEAIRITNNIYKMSDKELIEILHLNPKALGCMRNPTTAHVLTALRSFPNEHCIASEKTFTALAKDLSQEALSSFLMEVIHILPSHIRYFSVVPDDVMWYLAKNKPSCLLNAYEMKETQAIRDYMIEQDPDTMFNFGCKKFNPTQQLKVLQRIGRYRWTRFQKLFGTVDSPEVTAELAILKDMKSEYVRRLTMIVSHLLDVIGRLPVIKLVLANNYIIYGSFMRWFCREYLVSGVCPSMERVYQFLENSDLDISVGKVDTIRLLHQTEGVIVEHIELTEYKNRRSGKVRTRVFKTPISVDDIADGNYTCWIPCDKIAGGWLRCDLMLEAEGHKNDDYSVNSIALTNGIIKCGDPENLVDGLIMPVVTESTALKKLYRVKKLLSAGYKLHPWSKGAFRAMFDPIRNGNTGGLSHVCVSDRRKPSTTEKNIAEIPPTKHTYMALTPKVLLEDPELLAIERWCAIKSE